MSLPEDLLTPGLELRQTHISWVFLGAHDVWKVKKPVDFGFLDFTTAEKRRKMCEAELLLNRRLAPKIYRDVVPVRRDVNGRLRFGGKGDVVDWAVHMERLPDRDRADRRLEDGRMEDEAVAAMATRLARFHDACDQNPKTDRFGTVEVIGANVRENFDQARGTLLDYVTPDQADEIESWQTRFLGERESLFEARIRAGRIRDGHGDLRLEHVYLDDNGNLTMIDCIEFNERFRFADVCADVVFLAMDFARLGRVDLAERFLALYARDANDFDLYPLVDFYESYRAFVRGKIAAMVASSLDTESHIRETARHDARRYYLLALASERRSIIPPALIAVGGVIASGKSTVATHLGSELAVPMIDADRTRKFLAGVPATTPMREQPWQGIYSDEFGETTYEELRRRAGAVLMSGRPVIVDASFRSSRHRLAMRALASELGVPFAFVECRPGDDVCRERLREREGGVSDGRFEILDDFVKKWEPVSEFSAEHHVVLDTNRSFEETMDALRARLPVSFARIVQ